jgi:Starch binding domain/GDSL-like Lipase/Acylhydrolase family/Putative papain-like cysteine peptidase (DUF1796)
MYNFQVSASTKVGEFIGLVGSAPELGAWDITKCLRLHTNSDQYPIWRTAQAIQLQNSINSAKIEYKYVRFDASGYGNWESFGLNRWIPLDHQDQTSTIMIDDGAFGYLQPYPFGFLENNISHQSIPAKSTGLKIVVIGSSVALGHKAWMFDGWAAQLGQTLQQKYGHQLVNVSEAGANVSRTIDRFGTVVTPEQPDIVIIALSLGNEGFAHCLPHQRQGIQRRFESGLLQLVQMTRALGALPMLAGVYPHGDYRAEHNWLLQDTNSRMLTWGIPILNWLAAVNNGQGQWQPQTSFDPAHPNTFGHRLMYEAIDLQLFQIDQAKLAPENRFWQPNELPIYLDQAGFSVCVCVEEKRLRISNPTINSYTIAPYWRELQTVLQNKARLLPGVYLANHQQPGVASFLAVQADGQISTVMQIPPGTELEYSAAFNLFAEPNPQTLFYDGELGILKCDSLQDSSASQGQIWAINESDHEYNLHPMWPEVRSALKVLPAGVYTDPLNSDAPFRTMMIGQNGLESRIKLAPQSAVILQYKCKLSDISRVGIIPLGDRCAVRMMLYKMGYDGPAFPFDLSRTTKIADIADIIENRFTDMWSPHLLHYNSFIRRIYHSKWTGLSFAHEVEDSDDPVNDMSPIYDRMRTRYTARAERFWYTIEHCDRVLFIRTGIADRAGAIDLLDKLKTHCQGKPFQLLILSPQNSIEFQDLPHTLHYNLEFNPDLMYDDLGHWMYCTEVMQGILESMGVSSKNLFWCPPNPAQEIPSKSEVLV